MTERLNALTGIDGFWTEREVTDHGRTAGSLNALTGIDGFWTRPGMDRV